ncbi:MAG: GTPase RsgA, partial [Blastocatellia bacterium]
DMEFFHVAWRVRFAQGTDRRAVHTMSALASSITREASECLDELTRLRGEDRQRVATIRAVDDRGHHTTRHRELVLLPNQTLVLDTPGMREIQLWDLDDGVETVFDDIDQLAQECRFRDCSHEREPGCAVQAAIKAQSLSPARLESYRKLQQELAALALRKRDRKRPGRGPSTS